MPRKKLTEEEEIARVKAMYEYEQNCRFTGCSHIGEPDCGVKEALAEGKISQSRYNNYVQIYNELKDKRKY